MIPRAYAAFLSELENAAARRELLEVVTPERPDDRAPRAGILPLWRIPSDRATEPYGVAGAPSQVDRFLVVAHRVRGARPYFGLELVTAAWALGAPDLPVVRAPEPSIENGRTMPLIRLELLAWAARLGVDVVIRYKGAPEDRRLWDLRVVPEGPIRATDLGRQAARTFTPELITGLVAVSLSWDPIGGYQAEPPQDLAPAPRALLEG